MSIAEVRGRNWRRPDIVYMATDPSQLLAQKMLEGWCMLNKECGDCGIPIMKSRAGEEICVGCGGTNKKEAVQVPPPAAPIVPGSSQAVIERKIAHLLSRIDSTEDVFLLQSLGQVLKTYLEVLKLVQEVRLS